MRHVGVRLGWVLLASVRPGWSWYGRVPRGQLWQAVAWFGVEPDSLLNPKGGSEVSVPFRSCLVAKAANGNEQQYQKLLYVVGENVRHGSFTKLGCRCKKRCHASRAKRLKLLGRFTADYGSNAKRPSVKRVIALMLGVNTWKPEVIELRS